MGLYELLRIIIEGLEKLNIPYLVTGSVASIAYGEPRLTNDIDMVVDLKEDHIPHLLSLFPQSGFYISEEMIRSAIRNKGQFNIVHSDSGLKVDMMIRKETPHDSSRFSRRRKISPTKEYQADFAAPEDVILKKMEFYKEGESEKHLRDITGILRISPDEVDRGYVRDWAVRLGLTEIWDAILKRLEETNR